MTYVTFADGALGDDTPGADVAVRDLRTGASRMIRTPSGDPARSSSLSRDGRLLVFASTCDRQVYLADLADPAVTPVTLVSHDPAGTPGNSVSTAASISRDGHSVAFASAATNLTTTPDPNLHDYELFLWKVAAG